MNSLKSVVLFALVVLLSACGALNSFVPDQEVDNAFGLDGQVVTLSKADAQLQVQATESFTGSVSTEISDIDTSEIPDWVSPSALEEVLGMEPRLSVSSLDAGSLPDTIELSAASLSITVSDGEASLSADFASDGLDTEFTLEDCGVGECSYTVNLGFVTLMQIVLTGQELATLYDDILTNGDSPNQVEASFSLSLTSANGLPADAEVSLTLQTDEGVLKF